LALEGVAPVKMIQAVIAFISGISKEFTDAILKVEECLDKDDEEKALKSFDEGWIGEEAFALALYCFLRYPMDYKKAILRGANTNGDSDSIA
jgi:ADP-ribosylglycohydrolase